MMLFLSHIIIFESHPKQQRLIIYCLASSICGEEGGRELFWKEMQEEEEGQKRKEWKTFQEENTTKKEKGLNIKIWWKKKRTKDDKNKEKEQEKEQEREQGEQEEQEQEQE